MEKKVITQQPNDEINNQDINAFSNDKVGVEIEPDVKSNNVNLQMCSCSIVLNCFSPNNPESK
jgi:hypothetical protein